MRLIDRLKDIGCRRKELGASIRASSLTSEERDALLFLLRIAAGLGRLLEKKIVTVERLKRLFVKKTESSAKILREIDRQAKAQDLGSATAATTAAGADENNIVLIAQKQSSLPKAKSKGYLNANRIEVHHKSLKAGDRCPECGMGKLYRHMWGLFLKLIGQPVIRAVVYAQEKLRCNACGAIFSAQLAAGVADGPVATSEARAMVAVLRYGSGMPHWRLARLQEALGVPLPPSTQWDMMKGFHQDVVSAVFKHLKWLAAQGEIIHNDDTTGKVLELTKQIEKEKAQDDNSPENKRPKEDGEHNKVYTTGILSKVSGRKILLLFTGRSHAGNNLEMLLDERDPALGPPIQVADMLSANDPKNITKKKMTQRQGCIGHGRRGFVDCYKAFRTHCTYVILELKKVFKNDAAAEVMELTPERRLEFHQRNSGPVMDDLKNWFEHQFDEKLVEPNSELGGAISYMLKHWEAQTLFLRVPGAPITNNDLEREFKPAQSHLKNSLFYKTVVGAQVGDAIMSLNQTAILNGENPYEYFVALQDNVRAVNESPEQWLPWNWRETLAKKLVTIPGQKPMVLASSPSGR